MAENENQELKCDVEGCGQLFKTPQALASHKRYKHSVQGAEAARANNEGAFHLPSTLKVGQGREMISPEAIMNQYLLGDGDAGKWMLKGMMMLRAAQMMVLTDVEIMKGQADAQSKAIQPILDIMQKSREDMDTAAQRAKESNEEIAMQAAAGVGMKVTPKIDQLASQMSSQATASSPNPMQSLMVSMMSPAFQKAGEQVARLFGATQPGQGQPEQPQPGNQAEGQENAQQPQQPAQQWSPSNVEYHSREELED